MVLRKTNATNPLLKKLINRLTAFSNEHNAPIWKRIAKDLSKPSRRRRSVNLIKINDNTKENDVVIVPGKVLGIGNINHRVTVAAWEFSKTAKNKIPSAISIEELMKKNPKGSKVKIIG